MSHRLDIPVLETERLTLRAPRTEDFPAFAAFLSSNRASFIGGPVTDSMQLARTFGHVAGIWVLRGYGSFILERRDTGEAIGHCGPWHPIHWPERELGWCLWSAEVEGKGFMVEAMRRVHGWVFDELGWETCVSYIDAANARSIAVAERLGARIDRQAATPNAESCLVYRHAKGAA